MRVLTLAHCTSYIAFTASLILGLVALMSTRNTSVLISSIFFIADSVVTGHWMIRYLSSLSRLLQDFLGYFGSFLFCLVLGLKKCTLVRTFRTFFTVEPFTALATLPAFLEATAFLLSPSAFFSAFGIALNGLWATTS
eukprot:CAMPEP_0170606760 /NCGR_PEP_ID=MMETSP0224-20130122/20688_1 /TAXON_ID=285029 /ORGANISM="Togula jolla, Strain CCCM 725" /LENGTH=137 /DNA_ID=CAMNT_0010931871 /DNA_START=240 /DNA_END=653 /DNA_ORIENTATION=-